MADKRKDHKGRTLKVGECQGKDLSYQYRYTDLLGKRHSVYSWRLLPSDKTPMGKKDGKSLREKENEIQHMVAQGMTGLGANIVHLYETLQEGGMSYGSITFFHKLLITWNDVDMKNRIITIEHQLQYKKFMS